MTTWTGARVKELRMRKNLSQRELGDLLGYAPSGSQSQIALWERTGNVSARKFALLDKINNDFLKITPKKAREKSKENKTLNLVRVVQEATNMSAKQIALALGSSNKRFVKDIARGAVTGKLREETDTLIRMLINVCYNLWPETVDLSHKSKIFFREIYAKHFSITEEAYVWAKKIDALHAEDVLSKTKTEEQKVSHSELLQSTDVLFHDASTQSNNKQALSNNRPHGQLAGKVQELSVDTPFATPVGGFVPAGSEFSNEPLSSSGTHTPAPPPPPPAVPVTRTAWQHALEQKPRNPAFLKWYISHPNIVNWLNSPAITADEINRSLDDWKPSYEATLNFIGQGNS